MDVNFFKRKYGYEIGGFWVPRVTAITDIVAKPGLLKYYANQPNFTAARQRLKTSANWGTLTHQIIEEILKGKEPEIHPKIKPSIQAFYQWQDKNRVRILDPKEDIEKTIFDLDHFYAGRMDVLIEVNGKLGILDIKTGTGIWEEYSLQTAAYLNAYNKMTKGPKTAQTRWILRVDQYQECLFCQAKLREKSGHPQISGGNPYCHHQFSEVRGIFEFKELPELSKDFKAFLSAKELWEWYNQKILREIENYPKNLK
jgi:hypothetical protein